MLDIGWTEMAVIALVALVVIGPKDLPKAMRGVAKWVRKARALSREFQSGLDEMMRESELDEAKKSIESVRRYNVDKLVEEELDPTGSVSRELKELDQTARDRPSSSAKAVANGNGGKGSEGKDSESKGSAGESSGGESASARPDETAAKAAPAKKGRLVSHPAKVAPGNSVRPPASEPAEAAPEATAKPAPKATPGAAKKTSEKAASKTASRTTRKSAAATGETAKESRSGGVGGAGD